MNEETKNKFKHIDSLIRNPLSDINNINRLKKELEFINVANFSQEDWQLYNQVFN